MEWREQSTISYEMAFTEAQRWVEEVTRKRFVSGDFRSALENGVLLCDLMNKLKPGIIKRVNRLSTPIAGLDNVNVFLKACAKLGLNDSQLFHPGDLQDVSTRVTVRREETKRRLKNVLITVYWLGRKAQADRSYSGPQLNFKAFEGLLGVALSKALEESSCSKLCVRDSGYGENWYPDREELFTTQPSYRREDSVESLDSVDSRVLSVASDYTLTAGSEGFGSDAEADHCFRMSEGSRTETKSVSVRERGNVPSALRRKRIDRHHESGPLPRSKSMSDLALEPIPQEFESTTSFDSSRSWKGRQGKAGVLEPSAIEQVRSGRTRQYQTRTKDNEARWQDDLNRWKSRRLSANLDLLRKKEEREKIELITSRGGEDGLRTAVLKGVQEESEQEGILVLAAHQQSQAANREPSYSQEPSSRVLPSSQPPELGSTASDEAFVPPEASPLTSKCSMPGLKCLAGTAAVGEKKVDPAYTPEAPPTTRAASLTNGPVGVDHGTDLLSADQNQEETAVFFSPPSSTDHVVPSSPESSQQDSVPVQHARSMERSVSGGTRMFSTLPRGFRRSEGGSRLFTAVTPRPFGSKHSKVSSLPRFYSMDDSHKSLVKVRERPQLPKSFTFQEEVATVDSTHCTSHQQKETSEEEKEEVNHSAPQIHSFMSASMVATSLKQRAVSESTEEKVGHTDMRVSLNQKANSGRDFGFQTHWDSAGVRINFVQPGSPAQLCHLQAGDEILAVGGQYVAKMSYEQWKANMDAALKEGSLLMDIRRHGQNGHPEHCVTVDSSSNLSAEKVAEPQVNGHPVNGLPTKPASRSFRDVPVVMRNKGGSESAISDLQVPSISASSSRWSWDTEEEKRRQEKWQMEQERLLQEKYRRDQERLDEEWRQAQLEAAEEECSSPERAPTLPNGNTAPFTSPPFLQQSSSPPFVASSQRAAEAGPVQSRQVTLHTAAGHLAEEECDSATKITQWPSESYGFAKLTASDRKKSKSTPALDSSHKQESRVGVKKKGRLSQAEKERLQILDEMRKKTQLHTDSSWIRQRSTCTISKEPISVAPMRRYDSLDNLHTSSSSKSFSAVSNPARPHSALASITPYRGYSGRCSLGPGAAIFSSASRRSSSSRPGSCSPTTGSEETPPTLQQHSRLVSGRRICSRCEQPLGKGAAMVIDSLDLCYHVGCFKCVSCWTDLGRGSKSRAQVRVRRRQLFCDTCHGRLRVRSIIPK